MSNQNINHVGICCSVILLATPLSNAADSIPVLIEPDGVASSQMHLVWQTDPGARYNLQSSSNLLSTWSQVPGYPAAAESLSQEHAFTLQDQGFLRVSALDEHPPRVVKQYPTVDGFAVPRFADIAVQLDDPSGVDPASIRVTVGSIGPVAHGDPGLVITSNTITYDSGSTPLGDWGATVSATLVAADTLGYTLTNTWSFRLEPQPRTANNIFVFGSPAAQLLGQQVRGPAAVLARSASSASAPVGIVPSADWSLTLVDTNRVVLSYQGGSPPSLNEGDLICNLAPTSEKEIFYRRVLSMATNTVRYILTIYTADALLTDFVWQGAVALSSGSMVLGLNGAGAIVSASSMDDTLTFPRIGMDLSGAQFGLREDGYQFIVQGMSRSSGSKPIWLSGTLPECSWWHTPRVRASLELDGDGMKTFEAIDQGEVSYSEAIHCEVTMAGASPETVFPVLPGTTNILYVGQLGPVPVFATLKFTLGLKAEASAGEPVDFGVTYRQDHGATFGLSYERDAGLKWVDRIQSDSPDFRGELSPPGALSFHIDLEPRLEFMILALAGMEAAVAPRVTAAAVPAGGGAFDGRAEANVDLTISAAGPVFARLGSDEELDRLVWHGERPLGQQNLMFTVHPKGGTVAPGEAFSFTCAVDAPSPPLYRWFHNTLPIPGQTSSSLLLPRVNPGHAGSYVVRVAAGGLTADSIPATLVVGAETPGTLDSDGDGIPDLYETNTGVWLSPTNRGTSPCRWDSDGDGLSDRVEDNTAVYVSRDSTGTNPNRSDTDGDALSDGQEIDHGTNPFSADDAGNYLLIDISAGPTASYYPVRYLPAAPADGWPYACKTTTLVLRRIPAGTFIMGSPSNELSYVDFPRLRENEHQVTLTQGFYIGIFEVTQRQWERVMGNWPSYFYNPRETRPVERVSYMDIRGPHAGCDWPANGNVDAGSFMGRLRAKTGRIFDLPTEAQWEYACRAGTITAWNSGKDITNYGTCPNLDVLGRYWSNGGGNPSSGDTAANGTAQVGSYQPNAWGLYDCHGNVDELCLDFIAGDSPSTPLTDPRGPPSAPSDLRMCRGSSWDRLAYKCRSAARSNGAYPSTTVNFIGFRAVVLPGFAP